MFDGLSFVFDIDGTICPIKKKEQKYEDLVPYKEMVDKIREYKKGGAKIIFYTSRNMNSYQNNVGMINANTAKTILNWLDKWEIPYDEIYYGKPWPGHRGYYVDDRTVRPDEFLRYSEQELDNLCNKSKCVDDE